MNDLKAALGIIENFRDCSPEVVIAAIDKLFVERQFTPSSWDERVVNGLRKIKWSMWYPTVGTVADLPHNPGFYSDFILYSGYWPTRQIKDKYL